MYDRNTKKFKQIQWKDISIGDVLRIEDGKQFPADLILLSSSEPQGICYIETSNLDGETNLKIKTALPLTSDHGDNVDGLVGELQCEQPNRKLYEFNGNIKLSGDDKPSPLNPSNILLRGSKLMNTPWICGMYRIPICALTKIGCFFKPKSLSFLNLLKVRLQKKIFFAPI